MIVTIVEQIHLDKHQVLICARGTTDALWATLGMVMHGSVFAQSQGAPSFF